ncbi:MULTISPECIES: hypothetical protein [Pseudophaeobacter]|jgi:hypothetical protein|uniref:hypothetical protein n=1 Tax=Pseudophaeobacter TaxID=1541822 RepID=UPI00242B7F67|nr:hypothetical protein [Pseudophaeobacter profundi]
MFVWGKGKSAQTPIGATKPPGVRTPAGRSLDQPPAAAFATVAAPAATAPMTATLLAVLAVVFVVSATLSAVLQAEINATSVNTETIFIVFYSHKVSVST